MSINGSHLFQQVDHIISQLNATTLLLHVFMCLLHIRLCTEDFLFLLWSKCSPFLFDLHVISLQSHHCVYYHFFCHQQIITCMGSFNKLLVANYQLSQSFKLKRYTCQCAIYQHNQIVIFPVQPNALRFQRRLDLILPKEMDTLQGSNSWSSNREF